MFEWFMSNWLLISVISGGFYFLVLLLEKFLVNRNNKKIKNQNKVECVDVKEVNVQDVQI